MTDLDFSSFDPLPPDRWRSLIERDLKGRAYESLRRQIEPGIAAEPFYTHVATHAPAALDLPDEPAQVVQYLAVPEAAAAREALLKGADALFVDAHAEAPLPGDWPDAPTWFAPDLPGALAAGKMASAVDGITLREAGATRVETIAWMAAQASALLLAQNRTNPPLLDVMVGVGPELIPEIAFVRASRIVLQNVAAAYGADGAGIHVLAVTSRYHQTAYAAHTNLLRGTLGAAAALIGGADALCVRPYDLLSGPSPHGLRLARQTHLLLRDESHLSRVVDPSAGAYAAEHLARALAEAAWERFGAIESAGGFFAAAVTFDLASSVRQQHDDRQSDVLSGRQRVVGITRSADPADTIQGLPAEPNDAFAPQRLVAPLERLRHDASRHAFGAAVLLLFGDPPVRSARAGFARDFLGTAGLKAVEVQVVDELPTDAPVVVLCAGDDDYDSDGIAIIRQIRQWLPETPIWVAGRPESETALHEAGASFFLSARAPLYDHLRDALATLAPVP